MATYKSHKRSKAWGSYAQILNTSFEQKLGKIAALGLPGQVLHVSVRHDQGCPALRTHNLRDCTCTPVIDRMSNAEGEQDYGNIGELLNTPSMEQ